MIDQHKCLQIPDLDDLLDFLKTHPPETFVELTASHYGMPPSQLLHLLAIYEEFKNG